MISLHHEEIGRSRRPLSSSRRLGERCLVTLAILLTSACGGGSAPANTVAVVSATEQSTSQSPAPATATATAAAQSADSTSLPSDASGTRITISAGDLVARSQPYVVGAATHFALDGIVTDYNPAKSAKIIADNGVASFRDDLFWNQVSPDWDLKGIHLPASLSAFEALSTARPLLILNNGNPAVAETSPPVTDKGRSAFADFAARAVTATLATNPIVEIWNEWNLTAAPAGTPAGARLTGAGNAADTRASLYYAQLATSATAAIKAAAPRSTVLVGAAGDDPDWAWSTDIVRRGALQQADGLSVHLYNHCLAPANRTAGELLDRLDRLQTAASTAVGGKVVPMYITEWGWPGGTDTCSVPAAQIADNVGQFLLRSAATPYVMGSWIYQIKDTGTSASNLQDNFGLYDYGFNAKPQQCAFADASAQIAAARAMTFERTSSGMVVVKARTATGLRLFVWSSDAARGGTVTVGGSVAFSARRLCRTTDTIASGRNVGVGSTPVVIDVPDTTTLAINVKLT